MPSSDGSDNSASPRGNSPFPSRDDDRYRAAAPHRDGASPDRDGYSADEPYGDNVFSRPHSSSPDFDDRGDHMSTSDGAALSGGGRHSDGRPAEPGLRVAFPRHLRDELPALPPPSLDGRRGADMTVPMPAIAVPRSRLNPRIWLSAAGVVIVMVTTTLLLTNRERTSPEPDAWAGPGPVVTESPADDTSILPEPPPASATPSATTRPGAPASSRPRGQRNTTGAVVVPVAPTTVEGPRPPTPTPSPKPVATTPPAGPTPLPITVRSNRPVVATNGLCLDNANANSTSGNPIQVYQCNNSVAQKISHNSDGSLLVQGKCVKPVRSGAGSLVQLGTCDASGQWYFRSDRVLVNKQSLLCLTGSPNVGNGQRPTLETCTGGASQQWAFA